MCATRPRSLQSILQLNFGVTVHRKFGSRILIDLLHSLSVCCSYYELKLYEVSLAMQHSFEIKKRAFLR